MSINESYLLMKVKIVKEVIASDISPLAMLNKVQPKCCNFHFPSASIQSVIHPPFPSAVAIAAVQRLTSGAGDV